MNMFNYIKELYNKCVCYYLNIYYTLVKCNDYCEIILV